MEKKVIQLREGLQVAVIPYANHEFLMTTKNVADGYGIGNSSIQAIRKRHINELIENKHYVTGATIRKEREDEVPTKCTNFRNKVRKFQDNEYLWTKAGIIRLGFFVRSPFAIQFRDWAEQLILDYMDNKPAVQVPEQQMMTITDKNLLRERLLDIMSDVMLIEQSSLRLRISKKLMELK